MLVAMKYGGGSMVDLGSHQIDLFFWAWGVPPTSVTAIGGRDAFTPRRQTYDRVYCIYEFAMPDGTKNEAVYQVIFMTTRYKQNRLSGMDKKEAVEKAVASAAQSILVSGLGFFAATYGVGLYSNVDIISSMCRLIARGALLSAAVVLFLLPAMLLLLDKFIVHTTLDMKTAR